MVSRWKRSCSGAVELRIACEAYSTHVMRNEVMEELCLARERESNTKRDPARRCSGSNCGLRSETGKKRTQQRNRHAKRLLGTTQSSLPARGVGAPMPPPYAVARPRKRAKASGTPNSVIVIGPAVEVRTLRASRSVQESRQCALCSWDRGGASAGGLGALPGTIWTSPPLTAH